MARSWRRRSRAARGIHRRGARAIRAMRILVLGCKDYPAFATPWVHSGGMEVYTERMVRSLAGRAEFTLYTAGGQSDDAARVTALGARGGLRPPPRPLLVRSLARV